MPAFTEELKTSDGLRLHGQGWTPDQPRAAICLVHGHGEHLGRYAHLAAAFNAAGFALMGFDLRGHGRSEGPRGHTPSYEHLMADLDAMLEKTASRFAGLPLFLYGHSMGGNLVLNYGLRRQPRLAGIIATGPWLRLAFEPPPLQVFLARAMDRLYPTFTQASKLETAALSRDPAIVQAYEQDHLVHDRVSARLFAAMYQAGLWALENAHRWQLPLLLMHGEADRLTSPQASAAFARRAGPAVHFKLWPGWYHEIHNEPERETYQSFVIGWIKER